ncbi:c-type cytochrome [Palleronia rufa]|uniref:c-type cytochrome n=1 Tax=Palleronia rufa TaxID=1530186 RepID=UPI00068FB150|nr:c-type cytochrome [Palleronia rufa]
MAPEGWIAAGLAILAGPAVAQGFEETKEQCVACHAAESAAPETPLLGGIDEKYALLQLVAFREGNRAGDVMPAMVDGFSNDDLRAAAAWVASLDPPAAPETGADVDMEAGRRLAESNRCNVCHKADYRGGDQIPPLRNQHAAYLESSLLDYKAERRIGDRAAMVEIAQALSDDEIATLAGFLATLPAASE